MRSVSRSELEALQGLGATLTRKDAPSGDMFDQLRRSLARADTAATDVDIKRIEGALADLKKLAERVSASAGKSESGLANVVSDIKALSKSLHDAQKQLGSVERRIESALAGLDGAIVKAVKKHAPEVQEIHHHPVVERIEQPVHTVEKVVEVVKELVAPPSKEVFDIAMDRGRITKMESDRFICSVRYDQFYQPEKLIVKRKEG